MSKTTKAYSLEDDIIEIIESYRRENNLKSSSNALERIVLEFKKESNIELKQEIIELKSIIKEMIHIQKSIIESKDEKATDTELESITIKIKK